MSVGCFILFFGGRIPPLQRPTSDGVRVQKSRAKDAKRAKKIS
jgi:hypothetical protein